MFESSVSEISLNVVPEAFSMICFSCALMTITINLLDHSEASLSVKLLHPWLMAMGLSHIPIYPIGALDDITIEPVLISLVDEFSNPFSVMNLLGPGS